MANRDSGEPPPTPSAPDDAYIVWKLAAPRAHESCRWESVDGRWVSLSLGHAGELGHVVVADSGGRRQLVDSFEGALALARSWRG